MLNVKFSLGKIVTEDYCMKIAVCIKQAIDVAQLRIDTATKKPLVTTAPRKMSDIDRNAVEEAIRIKEKHGGTVTAITIGPEKAREVLREALAMGVDEVYLISDEKLKDMDTGMTAKILSAALKKFGPFDIVLCGEVTIDTYSGQVGPKIAEYLEIPCITHVRSVKIENEYLIAERDLEDKYEVVKAKMPVLITVTKEINVPRLPPLMAILRASRKPINVLDTAKLEIEVEEPKIKVVDVQALEMKRKMHIIKDKPVSEAVQELIKLLMKEGVL